MEQPQWRQRPRRASQLTRGRLSKELMGVEHPGQKERGLTMDSPRGTL